MIVNYQGKQVSIYRLGKLSGCPLTTLYRAYHKGLRTGESLISEAQKHLVEYEGQLITVKKLCSITNSDYRAVLRRVKAGVDPQSAVLDKVDRRGSTKAAKLTPSDVLGIYVTLFRKEKSQRVIASEFGIDQSTVSDIWRHKRWGWLTAPLRHELELTTSKN